MGSMAEQWRATFPGDVVVEVTAEGWSVDGPSEPAQGVTDALAGYFESGWPGIAGQVLDRSPGFDPRWMFLRLVAAGAVEIDGPCEPCDEEAAIEYPEDAVVG